MNTFFFVWGRRDKVARLRSGRPRLLSVGILSGNLAIPNCGIRRPLELTILLPRMHPKEIVSIALQHNNYIPDFTKIVLLKKMFQRFKIKRRGIGAKFTFTVKKLLFFPAGILVMKYTFTLQYVHFYYCKMKQLIWTDEKNLKSLSKSEQQTGDQENSLSRPLLLKPGCTLESLGAL